MVSIHDMHQPRQTTIWLNSYSSAEDDVFFQEMAEAPIKPEEDEIQTMDTFDSLSMTNLGNIIVDPHDVLARIACPALPNIDALCYWFQADEIRSSARHRRPWLHQVRYFWGDCMWALALAQPEVFTALTSLVLRKRARLTNTNADYYCRVADITSMELFRGGQQQQGSLSPQQPVEVTEATLVQVARFSLLAWLRDDVEEAFLHLAALRRMVNDSAAPKMDHTNWLFTWWMDIAAAFVTDRAPTLPFYIPDEWKCDVFLSLSEVESSWRLSGANVRSFGSLAGDHIGTLANAMSLLHQLSMILEHGRAYSDRQQPPYALCYELLSRASTFHAALATFPPDTADLSELLAIGLKLAVLALMTPFVTQDGSRHKIFLARAVALAPSADAILPRWKTRANAAGLLWLLFVLAAEATYHSAPEELDAWIARLRKPMEMLHVATRAGLVRALQNFPCAKHWQSRVLPYLWTRLKPRKQQARWRVLDEEADHPLVVAPPRLVFPTVLPFLEFPD